MADTEAELKLKNKKEQSKQDIELRKLEFQDSENKRAKERKQLENEEKKECTN